MSTKTTTQGKKIVPPTVEAPEPPKYDWQTLENPAYPEEFVRTFINACFKTLDTYLELTHAPKETQDLLDLAQVMHSAYSYIDQGNKIPRWQNECLIDNISEASHLIVSIGGEFMDHISGSCPRENSVIAKLRVSA